MRKIVGNQGTTLIEAMVSLVLVAITTMGGIALYFNTTELQAQTLHKKMVTELVNSQMERYRKIDYNHSSLAVTGIDPDPMSINIGGMSTDPVKGQGITTIITEIDEYPPDCTFDYKEIQIDIDWNEAGKIKRNLNTSFITYVVP
ncbi:MAG: type II secretion system protein [Candidatus Omnitrophica bacterium]|nr:type II secretion system protein [Candidatus Omnitrophota bacterium]